jgi:hypothetical protein
MIEVFPTAGNRPSTNHYYFSSIALGVDEFPAEPGIGNTLGCNGGDNPISLFV